MANLEEIEKAYQSANRGVAIPDLACIEEDSFNILLKSMGVTLEEARKNCNIEIVDGVVWVTPLKEDKQKC